MALYSTFSQLPQAHYLALWDGKAATLTAFQAYAAQASQANPTYPPLTVTQDASANLVITWSDQSLTVPSGSWVSSFSVQPGGSVWSIGMISDVVKTAYYGAPGGQMAGGINPPA